MFQWLLWRIMNTAEGTRERSELGQTEATVPDVWPPDDDVDAVDDMHGNTPNRCTQPRGGTVRRLGASIRRTG
jgi:hypothetical protein